MTLADKIVVLRAGRVEQVGTPMELYGDPDNRFVAGFIGSPSMNFLRGSVESGKVRIGALGGAMVETGVALPENGQPVIVGLRPQHLSVTVGPSDIVLDMRERLGGVSYDYLDTPQGERLIAEARSDEMIAAGSPVRVAFDPANALFFDPQTERRLR